MVAANPPLWLLFVVALTGTLSTDVVDNGAATTLEQVMLAAEDAGTGRVYGWYNAAGAAFGAVGALGAAVVGVTRSSAGVHAWLFARPGTGRVGWGVRCASGLRPRSRLPGEGDADRGPAPGARQAGSLSWGGAPHGGLFSVDAAGGGLVTTGFLSYYLAERYGVSLAELGWLFFAVSAFRRCRCSWRRCSPAGSGLVPTMVGTHLPSNVLLASMAFAPTFPVAVVLLVARTTLSQMDVPTRQALVMTVTTPAERTAAAATTNAARYSVRPFVPLLGGVLQQVSLGAPLLVAGVGQGRLRRGSVAMGSSPAHTHSPAGTTTRGGSPMNRLTPERPSRQHRLPTARRSVQPGGKRIRYPPWAERQRPTGRPVVVLDPDNGDRKILRSAGCGGRFWGISTARCCRGVRSAVTVLPVR